MKIKHPDVFHALDDNLEETLKKLRIEPSSSEASISIEIQNALKSIERGLGMLVANTNAKTNRINPAAFKDADIDQLLDDIRRLGILTRRIERELKGQKNLDKQ